MAESKPVDEQVLKQQAQRKQARGPRPGEMIIGGNQFTQQRRRAAVQAAAMAIEPMAAEDDLDRHALRVTELADLLDGNIRRGS